MIAIDSFFIDFRWKHSFQWQSLMLLIIKFLSSFNGRFYSWKSSHLHHAKFIQTIFPGMLVDSLLWWMSCLTCKHLDFKFASGNRDAFLSLSSNKLCLWYFIVLNKPSRSFTKNCQVLRQQLIHNEPRTTYKNSNFFVSYFLSFTRKALRH